MCIIMLPTNSKREDVYHNATKKIQREKMCIIMLLTNSKRKAVYHNATNKLKERRCVS